MTQELAEIAKKSGGGTGGEMEEKLVKYQVFQDSVQFRAFVWETIRIAVAVPLGVQRGNPNKNLRCFKLKKHENQLLIMQ